MNIKKINNEKGQVLLFVTVVMTIALSVGAAISTRTLSSLSRVSSIDTSNKVLSVAESAIEQYLVKDINELQDLQGQTEIIEFDDEDTNISTKADVTVDSYNINNQEDQNLIFNLETGNIKEINLENYNDAINICWYNKESALSYIIYDNERVTNKEVLVSDTADIRDNIKGEVSTSDDRVIYDDAIGCKEINIQDDSLGIRIKALYNNSKVSVDPSNVEEFPMQGFKITAVGTLAEEGKATSSRTIIAYRSLNYLSAAFDFTFYSQDEFNN